MPPDIIEAIDQTVAALMLEAGCIPVGERYSELSFDGYFREFRLGDYIRHVSVSGRDMVMTGFDDAAIGKLVAERCAETVMVLESFQ